MSVIEDENTVVHGEKEMRRFKESLRNCQLNHLFGGKPA
jgi:hypothetical protein